uniref:DIX domain-containing protein n=1 Tax=Daphnia galeata TaxID=27404 RepID=A0A8J2WLD4_9CRUS|nr:unnamed protein product [Daphnia galeata]
MQTNFDELREKYGGRKRKKARQITSNKPSTQRSRWKAFNERAEILANQHGAEIVMAVHFPNKKSASSKLKYYGKLEKALENCPETIAFHNFFLAQCGQHENDVTGAITSTVSDGGRDSSSDYNENTASVALIPQASTSSGQLEAQENTEETVFYVATDSSFDCSENTVTIITPTPKASTSSTKPAVAIKNTAARASCISTEHTIVIYNFGEEPTPFCSRIPGRNVTLKRFKECCITRNGNFKYFFKTILDYGSPMVVYQEVTDDSEVLPMWENKLIGMVKTVE